MPAPVVVKLLHALERGPTRVRQKRVAESVNALRQKTPYEIGTIAVRFFCVLSGQLAEAKGGVHHRLAVQTFCLYEMLPPADFVRRFPERLVWQKDCGPTGILLTPKT